MSNGLFTAGLLNPELDIPGLKQQLDAQGWVVIRDALRPEVAEQLHACLTQQVSWSLAWVDHEGSKKMWADELRGLSAEGYAGIQASAFEQAARGFSFLYDTYMMITAFQERRDPGLLLHHVTTSLNQPGWLNAMRQLTGEQRIIKSSAQATRYRAGHFLTTHNDSQSDELRYAAYVINLSKNWLPDWGGLLQFIQSGQVTNTITPAFNTISLFKTPRDHCVSPVGEFVTAERLSITGWLRGDDNHLST